MRKIKQEQKIKTIARSKLFLICLGLTVLFLAILQIILSNLLTSYGERLKIAESQIRQLKEEQEFLSQKLARERSLLVIGKKARELGFVESVKLIYLSGKRAQVGN